MAGSITVGYSIADPGVDAGRQAMWDCTGEVSHDALVAALEAEGVPGALIPSPVTPEAALARAFDAVCAEHKMRRIAVSRRTSWALVPREGDHEGDRISYGIKVTAWLDGGNLITDPPYAAPAEWLRDAFERAKTQYAAPDMQSWLLGIIETLHGVPLRRHGGVYYLSPAVTDQWEAIVRGVMTASSTVCYKLPLVGGADIAHAVLRGVIADTSSRLSTLVDAAQAQGSRGMKARKQELDDLRGRVIEYERLCSASLVDLRDKLGDVDAALSEAILLSDSDSPDPWSALRDLSL